MVECHSSCGEGIIPLDNDILIHVAPASRKDVVPLENLRVFAVPKGTCVVLRPGVWHHAPFVKEGRSANVIIVLPERTYANDCQAIELTGTQKLSIIG